MIQEKRYALTDSAHHKTADYVSLSLRASVRVGGCWYCYGLTKQTFAAWQQGTIPGTDTSKLTYILGAGLGICTD